MARGGKGQGRPAERPPRRGARRGDRAGSGDSRAGARPERRGAAGRGRGQRGVPRECGRSDARERAASRASAGDLIEGRRAAQEALALGLPVGRALIQVDKGSQDPALGALAREFEAAGVEVERVARPVLDSLSSHGAHQGIVLKVRPFRYAELADVIEAAGEGDALVIVLDHVTDEGNFGAIVRTAEVVGAAGVVVAKARAARVGVGAYKTSAGAVMHLPIAQVPNLARALGALKEAGFWVGGATEHAHDLVWDAPMGGRLALVMGSEDCGLSRLVRERCDFECRLPQRGSLESLNVAQAATALSYEWLRRTWDGSGQESRSCALASEATDVDDCGRAGSAAGYFGLGD